MIAVCLLAVGASCLAWWSLEHWGGAGRLEARVLALKAQAPASDGPGGPMTRLGELLYKRLWVSRRLERRLRLAGSELTVGSFVGLWAIAGALGIWAAGALSGSVAGAVAGCVAGLSVPWLVLEQRIQRRQVAFQQLLPDALMLIVNALRAGNTLQQAFLLVSEQVPEPVASEFKLTLREIGWGLPIDAAIEALADRVGSADLDLIATAMLVQRETGGNLSEVLLRLHASLRERIRLAGEIRSLTGQGRLTAGILLLLPVGVAAMLAVTSPDYLTPLVVDPRGQAVIAVALGLQAIGGGLLYRLIRVPA